MKTRSSFRLLSPIGRWVAGQLSHPHGWFGRTVMLRVLNRGNRDLIGAVVDRLAPSADTRLLDIGFGGGLALELARERGVVRLAGVDPSEAAVRRMTERPPKWAKGASMRIERGSVEHLPFGEAEFDAVLSTNTVYFMQSLATAFTEMRRVLAPRGRLALGFASADKMRQFDQITRHGFHLHTNEEISEAATGAGFLEVELVALKGSITEGDYILLATANQN